LEEVLEQSSHHTTAPEDRIPVFQKTVYSIGALVNQTQAAAIGAMVLVLNLGLGMNPALVGLVGTIPRLLDAFTDPLIGYTSDNTRSKYGRRRPYIFFGALISGIFFALMFQLYKGHTEMYYFWYFLIIQCLFILAFAFYSIPWIALGFEMSPDYHERTRLQGMGNSIAQLAWFLAPWLFTFMYTNKDLVHGVRFIAVIIGVFIAAGGILPAIFNKEHFVNLPQPQKKHVLKDFFSGFSIALKNRPFIKLCTVTFLVFNGFMLASAFITYVIFFYDFGGDYGKGGILLGVYGMFSAACMSWAIAVITAVSAGFLIPDPAKIISWFKGINKQIILLIVVFCFLMSYILKMAGINYHLSYLGVGSVIFIGLSLIVFFVLMISTCVSTLNGERIISSILNWKYKIIMRLTPSWLRTGIGKRNTLLIAIPISIVGYALKWVGYNPQHPYLLLIAAPFIAFGLGSVFTIISSMLADVCDLDELDNGTRREGTFGAIYWWMIKLGQAAASLISGVLLNLTGFNVALGGHQTAHTLLYMRLCDIGIPIVTSVIAIFIISTFDITEDKAYAIRKQLEDRRGKA